MIDFKTRPRNSTPELDLVYNEKKEYPNSIGYSFLCVNCINKN